MPVTSVAVQTLAPSRRAVLAVLDPRGEGARDAADLWWLMLWLGLATLAVVLVVLAIGARRGGPSPDLDGPPAPPDRSEAGTAVHRMVPWGGVVLPAVVIGVVLVATLLAMRSLPAGSAALYGPDRISGDALVVEVTGHRWWWEVRYPAAGVTTAGEVRIPVGVPVEVRLRSADVVHSFWVPRLAGKVDALPDHATSLRLLADAPGEHRGVCAEFCGLQHANMGLVVVAESARDHRAWIAAQQAPAAQPAGTQAMRGEEVFQQQSCTRCHAVVGGTGPATGPAQDHGPDLTHLASRRRLAGATLPNTPEALRAWLEDPQHVKPGTQMEALDVSADDLEALLAYLGGLR